MTQVDVRPGAPPPHPGQGPLVTSADVSREIERLFGDADGLLVVTVHGGDAGSNESFHELMESLSLFHGDQESIADAVVDAPDANTLAKALRVLAQPALQRRIMDQLLTAFGKRLIEPMRDLLDPGPQGSLMTELVSVRLRILTDVARLRVTPETRGLLQNDIEKLLSDAYLEMLAENEERVQQPRVQALAQETLHLLGNIFYGALQRWPQHAEQIAHAVSRRIGTTVRLRDIPNLLRQHIVAGIEEFLWVETSSEIEGALGPLFSSHEDIAAAPPTLDRRPYRELAEGCWALVSEYG